MSFLHTWGSTAEERLTSYPCDRYVERPNGVCFRAIDVAASVPVLFRWLCQLRVAPYSYDWIDNFGKLSPRRRDPVNERLAVGLPMMRIFRLVEFKREDHLTMKIVSTKAFGDLAVTYLVKPKEEGARLVVKIVYRVSSFSPMRWILPPGDLFMMRKQLLTLKRLAENEHAASQVNTSPPG